MDITAETTLVELRRVEQFEPGCCGPEDEGDVGWVEP